MTLVGLSYKDSSWNIYLVNSCIIWKWPQGFECTWSSVCDRALWLSLLLDWLLVAFHLCIATNITVPVTEEKTIILRCLFDSYVV